MRHIPHWLKYAGILMLIVLIMPLVAACGDDEGDGEADVAGEATEAVEPAPDVEVEETEEPAADEEATPLVGTPTTGEEPVEATAEAPGSPVAGGAGVAGRATTIEETLMSKDIEEAANEGGTLIEGSISDIATTFPVLGQDEPTFEFLGVIFETLFEANPDTLEPVGNLAQAWEANEDASVWTVFLREGVTWHDGQPFTAEDVQFTYQLHMTPEVGSAYTSDITEKIQSVEVVDDMTVRFNLNLPVVDFPLDLGVYDIVPKHIWEGVEPAAIAQDPGATGQDPARVVGTGPFMFEEWVPEQQAVAVRYENYWGGTPHLERYIYKPVADQAALVQQLKTGEIDYGNIPEASVAEFPADGDIVVRDYPTLSFTFYGMNISQPPFDDVQVRQALLYALDRQAMIDSIRFGFGQVAIGTMPTLSWAYNPDGIENKYPYDPELAQQLLEEAGWTDTDGDGVREKDGQPLAFTMYTNAGNQVREAYLAAMQQFWAEVGVQMTPQLEPFQALVERIQQTKDFQAFLIGFGWSATPDQSAMFSCDAAEGGFNFAGYCNEQVDGLLQEALSTQQQEDRLEIYTQFQNIIMEDLPVAILDFPQGIAAVNARVHNLFPNDVDDRFNAETWWVEE